ncbi:hypothetical protein EJ05DRAFT_474275 [Pseudovirgaria hyperparasitica]|uniref:Modin n=1 Tax=Pseudovirgaria hyperparasitica TaxID=470096 RepID=A0A6A6WEH1_9PEZI|nr:uncharacterized protein EJ05DRAFT_474275 [Pseudovirgaria hyperparasitica]KAF2760390.1 hypothetical protein EJ05DRAFT_474275 [Pseudovirgaria hyperparasitica]
MASEAPDNTSNIIAIVSLIISIIAFVVAIAQALQQYLASAEGYRKCAKPVMGHWAHSTRRRFRLNEVRFEVLFETPVLFVGTPENKRGPVPGRGITNIDGSDESYVASNTIDESAQEVEDREAANTTNRFRRVHTIDDERATWVSLLTMLQRAERAGRAWDAKHAMTPKGIKYGAPDYSMVVQMQKRKRSWDYMPDSVLKPYAQTTMSHLAELAVMLGMRWRTFDPDTDNLRAEGNGMILTSSQYVGLGLGVSFSVFSMTEFGERRTMPAVNVRKLVFGCVETMYDDLALNFGGDQEIRRTLQLVGCKQDTIEKWFKRRDHVRSVSFELVAMLSTNIRIRGSSFRRLPNPTKDPWNDAFSALTIVTEIIAQIRKLATFPHVSSQVQSIIEAWEDLTDVWRTKDDEIDIDLLEKVHDAIDNIDEWLLAQPKATVISVAGSHVTTVLAQLDDLESFLSSRDCDTEQELFEHYFNEIRPLVAAANSGTGTTSGSYYSPASAHSISLEKKRLREDVWVALMWRMGLWGLLHDYEDGDLNVLPGRLMNTRLPVYIL